MYNTRQIWEELAEEGKSYYLYIDDKDAERVKQQLYSEAFEDGVTISVVPTGYRMGVYLRRLNDVE